LVFEQNKSFKRYLTSRLQYRKGKLDDLASLRFEDGMSVSAKSLEFNVFGVGHELWIAIQSEVIIAIAVLAEENQDNVRILRLEVAPSRKKEGVGSALLRAVMLEYPQRAISVVPSDGTEEFYKQLGFLHDGRWRMRLKPSTRRHQSRESL
jgi:GNAT superfamily N-acetyltransferase